MVNKITTKSTISAFNIEAFDLAFGSDDRNPLTMFIAGGVYFPGLDAGSSLDDLNGFLAGSGVRRDRGAIQSLSTFQDRLDRGSVQARKPLPAVTLYTKADKIRSNEIRLYTHGIGKWLFGSTLVTRGGGASAGTTLYTENSVKSSGTIPLLIYSFLQSSGSVPLYVAGRAFNNNIPLYISGGFSKGPLTLFTPGHATNNSNITLYEQGHIPVSGNHTLFEKGHMTSNSNLSLYIRTKEWIFYSGNMPLVSFGRTIGTAGGLFGTTTLFTKSDNLSSGNLNLYSKGFEFPKDLTGSINLYVNTKGNADGSITQTQNIPLFVKNAWVSSSSTIPLFMASVLGTTGAIAASSTMNLFINRNVNSYSSNISLFTQGPRQSSQSLNLFLEGMPNYRNNIPLYLQANAQPKNNNLKLYTSGF